MTDITLIVAFVAGVVSFLSPCVLPIIPGFLAYLAGTSLEESQTHRRDIFLNSFFFVLGFSLVFALLGVVLNTILSDIAGEVQVWLARIGGTLIILFGLYLAGLLKIPFLDREFRLSVRWRFSSRYVTSLVFGAAFAVGWTPCVGAVLGGVLTLATIQPGVAFYLLVSYALGLGLPFLVVGLFAAQSSAVINRYADKLLIVSRVFGVVLVILGVLAFTQNLDLLFNLGFVNRIVG